MDKFSAHDLKALHCPKPLAHHRALALLSVLLAFLFVGTHYFNALYWPSNSHLPLHASAVISQCLSLDVKAGPTADFHKRSESDRFVQGTKPTLLRNAKIWTGGENGTEVVNGDILLDKGIIKRIGSISRASLMHYNDDIVVIDVHGAWVTPGIVDVHSHLGDDASPLLTGAADLNSVKGPILPWLRTLDGLNTHDDSYALSIAGGVTTSLVLPGSVNAIAGQAFVIKLRKTAERSPTSMLLEPPHTINSSFPDTKASPRWRQLKQACGENPSAVYRNTRMDTIWAFREAYDKARSIKLQQDEYCSKALSGQWDGLGQFPQDLQWEALVDVLRGRVKVHTHCYETVDLDGLIRLSNEFQFPIAAVHHASEAYLVPDLLKQAYGKPPAVALFATNARYKREAYRSSEFAPRLLAREGLKVMMKSDHPVINSRYLLYEAQQAFFYGMPENLALASVTSESATALGMDHRIGYVKEGWDADLVVWDSMPLALAATPTQTYIDGIPQLESAFVVEKPRSFQQTPKVPNFDQEAADAVKYEGLPTLDTKETNFDVVVFTNVKNIFLREQHDIQQVFSAQDNALGVFAVENGGSLCMGLSSSCLTSNIKSQARVVDLKGGSISPGLVSFGSPLGLEEIAQEDSTNDLDVYDPLVETVSGILGGDGALIRAADGLGFATRDAFLAYRAGVTTAITAPNHKRFFSGLGTSFSLSAKHKLEDGAVVQDVTAVHVTVRHFGDAPSVSTQIAALRRLLNGSAEGETGYWFNKVIEGSIPLVVEAHSADIIATLILLKKEVEDRTGRTLKLTITGASEAHLIAKELGAAGVGVIVNPARPFPYVWEDRRILPGPPLTRESAISKLIANNVTVGIGIEEIWSARNTRFDIGWAALEAAGRISQEQAIALASTNLERLLGVNVLDSRAPADLVATQGGGLMEMESRVVAVISPRRRAVDLF